MSDPSINQILARLTEVEKPEAARLGELLGTTLTPVQENPGWTFYKFDLHEGPIPSGELRLSKSGDRVLLILTPAEQPGIYEKDIDMAQWGELSGIDVNPRIPPEGTDAYIYHANGVKLSFQWTHTSRRLRVIALEWGSAA